ncbi:MAG: DnaJ C-terminal domain-containing protein [Candidatus Sericytochromatia bacterium]
MAHKDYYALLGVDRKADPQEIKKAFRRLARKYHPDVNKDKPNAQQKFKEVAEAYEVLGDPERRRQYDQGHIDQSWFSGTNFDNIRDIFERTARNEAKNSAEKGKSGKFSFGDFFNNLADSIGGKEPPASATGGPRKKDKLPLNLDLEQEVLISLEEAWSGAKKPVDVRIEKPCVLCGGTGQVGQQNCRNCYGKGKIRSEKHLEVKVPAGVRKGSRIRVVGEGLKDGEQRGNLYLVVDILPHPVFDADEQGDVHCEVAVTATEAILGAEVQVPTLSGRIKMKIPPGTQPGQVFRLRGKGMKHPRGQDPADQLISIQVVIPKHLSDSEKQSYRELYRSGEELRRHLR